MVEIKVLRKANENKNQLEFIDLTKPGYEAAENKNIPLEQALEVMHVIGRDGTVCLILSLTSTNNCDYTMF